MNFLYFFVKKCMCLVSFEQLYLHGKFVTKVDTLISIFYLQNSAAVTQG